MNWINTAENLSITIISFIVGVLLGAFVTIKITDKIISSNQEILIEAIHKPSTSISNDIKNKKGELYLDNKISEKDSTDKSFLWWKWKKKK